MIFLLKKRKLKEVWNAEVNEPIKYTLSPVSNGTIEISNRRVPMNNVITYALADYIADKIQYFNNKSNKYPIFLVIDRCPGGSVMAGYKIIKAIQRSSAPVYAVVKSYAASMAAIILLYTNYAYSYKNSLILHHQVLGASYGNITEQKEQLEFIEKWMHRLFHPLVKKMGLDSMDSLIKKMYSNNSQGDWLEFGDSASKLNWINGTIQEIKEKASSKFYSKDSQIISGFRLKQEKDAKGKYFVRLPRLYPYDFYLINNPDNYYQY